MIYRPFHLTQIGGLPHGERLKRVTNRLAVALDCLFASVLKRLEAVGISLRGSW